LDDRTGQRIKDILDVADELAHHLEGATKASFQRDKGLQRIAERLLEIAGEAATHVADEQAEAIDADWENLRAMRIILAHAYHRVIPERLWNAATQDLPRLAAAIRANRP
jgi:uncharacterized protein with HEPN domain